MLVATFNDTTGWVGKTIAFEKKQFVLEGHGPITPQAVMKYDKQGYLDFATLQTHFLTLVQAQGHVVFPGDARASADLVVAMVVAEAYEYGFQSCYCQTGGAPHLKDMSRKDRKRYEMVQDQFFAQVRHLRDVFEETIRLFDENEEHEENEETATALWGFPNVTQHYERLASLLWAKDFSDEELLRIEADRMTQTDGSVAPMDRLEYKDEWGDRAE